MLKFSSQRAKGVSKILGLFFLADTKEKVDLNYILDCQKLHRSQDAFTFSSFIFIVFCFALSLLGKTKGGGGGGGGKSSCNRKVSTFPFSYPLPRL